MLIVHVEEFPVSYATGEMVVIHPDVPNPELRRMLEKIVPTGGVPHEHCLVMGVPADEIVRLAEEQRADLIVVGTHGRRGLSRLLTGSVAETPVSCAVSRPGRKSRRQNRAVVRGQLQSDNRVALKQSSKGDQL